MEKLSQYMLVMEVDPESGRKFKHRIFVTLTSGVHITSDFILEKERHEAKKLSVSYRDVMTVFITKLQ